MQYRRAAPLALDVVLLGQPEVVAQAEEPLEQRASLLHADPFAMPQYKLAATGEAERLDAGAELSAATMRENIQRASNYIRGVVLFSVSLFFAGMSTKLSEVRLRTIALALGCVVVSAR